MQRVLEPEYVDTEQESDSYAAMDHSAANRAVVDRFLAIGGARCRTVIDLGTGPGDVPILLAQSSSIPFLLGVDAAETMLAIARRRAAAAGVAGRVRFARADVKELPWFDGSQQGVLSNTILHHIPEPVRFLREAFRVLAPGGVLLIRDLYRPATEAEAHRLVALHAAGADERQRRLFFDSFRAALTLDEAKACVREAGMAGAAVAMSSDRHYTIEIAR